MQNGVDIIFKDAVKSNFFELINRKSVRYAVSISYLHFTNIAVQKSKQSVCLHCGLYSINWMIICSQ